MCTMIFYMLSNSINYFLFYSHANVVISVYFDFRHFMVGALTIKEVHRLILQMSILSQLVVQRGTTLAVDLMVLKKLGSLFHASAKVEAIKKDTVHVNRGSLLVISWAILTNMVVYQKALRATQLDISTDLLQKITGRQIFNPFSLTVKPTCLLSQIAVFLMILMLISYKSSKLSSSPHGIPTGSSPVGSMPKSSPQSQHLTYHLLEKNKLQPQR